MLSVQNISDVAVTIKFDHGHQNCHENSTFTGDYPMARFERSRLKSVQEGPKIKVFVEFVKSVINYLLLSACQTHGKLFAVIRIRI